MNPPAKPPRSGVWIDHETGLIHIPGKAPEPLIGPTSGQAYEQLKLDEKKAEQIRLHMERKLRSVWICTQCKRKFSWFSANREREILKRSPMVKWVAIDGVQTETLVCFDPKCEAPIVMLEDAWDLRIVPGGRM